MLDTPQVVGKVLRKFRGVDQQYFLKVLLRSGGKRPKWPHESPFPIRIGFPEVVDLEVKQGVSELCFLSQRCSDGIHTTAELYCYRSRSEAELRRSALNEDNYDDSTVDLLSSLNSKP